VYRYHKEVFWPEDTQEKLLILCDTFKSLDYSFASHCIDRIKTRGLKDVENVLTWLKSQALRPKDVFEVYIEAGNVLKACFRLNYNSQEDLILVINSSKKIITLYFNSSYDKHNTLKASLYNRA